MVQYHVPGGRKEEMEKIAAQTILKLRHERAYVMCAFIPLALASSSGQLFPTGKLGNEISRFDTLMKMFVSDREPLRDECPNCNPRPTYLLPSANAAIKLEY